MIFYNETIKEERIRFTILHEIGHIVLNHKEHSNIAEIEANFFAKYAIAPPPVINILHLNDIYDISYTFGISYECAYYSMKYYLKWLQFHKTIYQNYEIDILKLIKNNT